MPGIHVFPDSLCSQDVDGRDKPGHDEAKWVEIALAGNKCGKAFLRLIKATLAREEEGFYEHDSARFRLHVRAVIGIVSYETQPVLLRIQ